MKPFLLLQLRPIDEVADNEYEAFLKFSGLKADQLIRIRMEEDGIPQINLDDYSGVIVGGGPSNVSDSESDKDSHQIKFEADLKKLLLEIVEKDFPYLGTCYGFGALVHFQGGEMSKEKYGEDVGAITIDLADEAKQDPILSDLAMDFRAFVGHKEACIKVPESAIVLASSHSCPVQMIRMKKNVYATQFHPELDFAGLKLRINIYKHDGYFPPEDAEELITKAQYEMIIVPEMILRNFVDRYKTD